MIERPRLFFITYAQPGTPERHPQTVAGHTRVPADVFFRHIGQSEHLAVGRIGVIRLKEQAAKKEKKSISKIRIEDGQKPVPCTLANQTNLSSKKKRKTAQCY